MSPDQVPSSNAQIEVQAVKMSYVPTGVSGRRQHRRYPLMAESQYIFNGHREPAITTDISSGGVFLKTETTLPLRKQIQVLIDWPVLLDQRCPLRLVINGRVLRSDARGTAVGIIRYDFRLRPKSANQFVA